MILVSVLLGYVQERLSGDDAESIAANARIVPFRLVARKEGALDRYVVLCPDSALPVMTEAAEARSRDPISRRRRTISTSAHFLETAIDRPGLSDKE
jgi:hypothetical protein